MCTGWQLLHLLASALRPLPLLAQLQWPAHICATWLAVRSEAWHGSPSHTSVNECPSHQGMQKGLSASPVPVVPMAWWTCGQVWILELPTARGPDPEVDMRRSIA